MKLKFYPKESNEIIGVYKPGYKKSLKGEVFTKCSKSVWSILNHIINLHDLDTNSSFTGVAYCLNEDQYDEKYGKGLAEQKAMLKYHTSMMKKYRKIIDLLRDALDKASELELKHYIKVRNIEEDYKKYYLGE